MSRLTINSHNLLIGGEYRAPSASRSESMHALMGACLDYQAKDELLVCVYNRMFPIPHRKRSLS